MRIQDQLYLQTCFSNYPVDFLGMKFGFSEAEKYCKLYGIGKKQASLVKQIDSE
jgi:hypothetical protein